MKFNNYTFVVVILLFSYNLKSQNINPWIFKVNTTSILNLGLPTVDLSIEKRFASKYSLSLEGGSQVYYHKNDTNFITPCGYKTKLEFRRYSKNHYFAINFFNRYQQKNSGLSYVNNIDTIGTPIEFQDNFGLKRSQYGANIVYGWQQTFYKRFIVDAYVGFGIRRVKIENFSREFNREQQQILGTDMVPYFRYLDLSDSSGMRVSLTLGLRLGVSLN